MWPCRWMHSPRRGSERCPENMWEKGRVNIRGKKCSSECRSHNVPVGEVAGECPSGPLGEAVPPLDQVVVPAHRGAAAAAAAA